MNIKDIKEEFLSFLWQYRKISGFLTSTKGEHIEVLHPGVKNNDEGPDFLGAKIRIGNTLWAGNVEIHVKSSDWDKHQHKIWAKYESVILHVVYEADKKIARKTNEELVTVELKNQINYKYLEKYIDLQNNTNWIPCHNNLLKVDEIIINPWLSRLLIERLERKTSEIRKIIDNNRMDWQTSFYQWLSSCFGFKLNNLGFLMLSKSLPLNIILKHQDHPFQVEALLMGQAGLLLNSFKDEYTKQLKQEYDFLAKKYSLEPIDARIWKFMRTRPSNFPTIRISQLANVISRIKYLLPELFNNPDINRISEILSANVSDYWLNHYVFDKESIKKSKKLGTMAIHSLIINAITPFVFLYGKFHSNQLLQDNAIKLLDSIPPEENKVTKKWKEYKIKIENAADSQSLIELFNNYCCNKKCVHCSIGNVIILGA